MKRFLINFLKYLFCFFALAIIIAIPIIGAVITIILSYICPLLGILFLIIFLAFFWAFIDELDNNKKIDKFLAKVLKNESNSCGL